MFFLPGFDQKGVWFVQQKCVRFVGEIGNFRNVQNPRGAQPILLSVHVFNHKKFGASA